MPDLTFFPDPNVDRVLGVVLELAAEVYTLRDRLHTVEALLERGGALARSDLEAYAPGEQERAQRLAERDALIARILAPMTAESDSPSPPFEPV
ncbi:MAG: hypothetical protein JO020_25685 [Chloroflexi bacterium]|nr:hypothetical protein [Chloroflexota bacterium]MBV9897565.1 hypothetical protein [Chloroflexota bacterium]